MSSALRSFERFALCQRTDQGKAFNFKENVLRPLLMRLSPGTRESWLSTRQAGSTTSSLLHCLLLFHSFIKFKVIMDEFQSGEETAFVVDEVTNIIKEAIEGAIGGNAYQHNKVNQWTSSVVEQCLNQLTKLGKPFKYIVTCVIMQKNGAGLHTASSCYWDNATDGSCTVRWENKTMYCIVSVFGLAI